MLSLARTIAIGAGVAVLWTTSVSAHHSYAMFDATKDVTLTGTVKVFEWTNPHVWIRIEVAGANGALEVWGVEGQSPNFLSRRGWSGKTFKAGDKVSIVIHPLKDGAKGGQFVSAVLPNGETKLMTGPSLP
ncbi:MAG: DUF6152 family protein [Steroidobacteraceae bacterium]